LRDAHVLGFVQPTVRLDGGRRRKAVGNRVKLYPAVIEAATWVKAREILAARRGTLTGRRGKTVANLFTGKVFCDTCGAPMRSDTSGHIDKQGRQDRSLVCTRYRESKVCTDKTRFNMLHYEFPILTELVDSRRTLLAPRVVNHSEKEIAEQLAGLRVEIAGLEAAMTALEPELGGPKIILTRYTAMAAEHEAKTKKADALETIVAAAASTNSPRDDIHKFMRELIGPAVRGDVDARERLRALLSRFDFKISGRLPGMAITFADGSEVTIDPPSMA
jgi:hypothetical protein